jgi:hypothetical protein
MENGSAENSGLKLSGYIVCEYLLPNMVLGDVQHHLVLLGMTGVQKIRTPSTYVSEDVLGRGSAIDV